MAVTRLAVCKTGRRTTRFRFSRNNKFSPENMDLRTVVAIAGGAVGAVLAVPVALGAAGFTSAGIAAGSVAAKIMASAAVANGGGVAAGSAVAVLQSAGAAGLSGAATAAVASAGAAVGWLARLVR